jgi:hypothetical protein
MAGVNITNVGLTFTNYIKDITETLNHTSKARTMTKKGPKWTGDHLEWRVHVGRSGAVGNSDDGGAFPVADYQKYVAAKAYRKFTHASIQLTDGVMATASGGQSVAKSVVSSEVDGMMRDILKYENGMFFKDGTGQVATIKATTNATTIRVDDARMLWEGATYEWYTSTTFNGNVTVSSVASAPYSGTNYAVVTLTATTSVTDGDILYWKGSKGKAINGLGALINTAPASPYIFQNVNCSTYPRYVSMVLSNSSVARDLTPTLFRQMLSGIKQKCGQVDGQGLTVIGSAWDLINVEELYEGELRLSPSDTVGGIAIASFQSALGKINVIDDADAPYGKMFFVDFNQINRAVQRELAWRRDGGEIFKRSDTAAVYTATALEVSELFIEDRRSSGRIDDLSVTLSTVY